MPLYEYKCKSCQNEFEALVSISKADKNQKCPKCGKEDTEKLVSAFSTKSSGDMGPAISGGGGGFT